MRNIHICSLYKKTSITTLFSFLKQSFTNRRFFGLKKIKSLAFDAFLSKTRILTAFRMGLGIVMFFLIGYSCANQGYPSGGPKDYDPPKVVKSTPVNGAMNYKKKEITIEFDEIIKLNDYNSKLVVSPPLKKRPKVTARAKKLSIVFQEDLQENTTYTLDFADAIQDNNEGNPLNSFVFSFSTGEVIDSFAVLGNVWNAEDLTPVEGTMVLAHKNLTDTAFTKDVPVRLAKTDSKGHFAIRNLSPGQYKIYALEDANRNYMFDQASEQIAWNDSVFSPQMEYVAMPDTIVKADSIRSDSIVFHDELVYTPNDIKLFMFEEPGVQQYLLSEERADSNKMTFAFNLPVKQFKVHPVDYPEEKEWNIIEPSVKNDTMLIWITDSALYHKDTLQVALDYESLDTLNQPMLKKDTLLMYHFEVQAKKPKKQKRGKGKDEVKEVKATLGIEKSSSVVDLFKSYSFIMPTPVKRLDKGMIKLYEKQDSLLNLIDTKLEQDTLFKRKYTIKPVTKWSPGGQYVFVMDSAAIEDVYGLTNDSIGKSFGVQKLESYGTVLVSIIDPNEDWLVQLVSGSGNVVQQKYVSKSGKFGFQYVKPGTYTLKIVVDKNNNGKWDTGKYASKLHPEQVMFCPSSIEVRANWDGTVEWNPNEFDLYEYVEKQSKKDDKKGKGKKNR